MAVMFAASSEPGAAPAAALSRWRFAAALSVVMSEAANSIAAASLGVTSIAFSTRS